MRASKNYFVCESISGYSLEETCKYGPYVFWSCYSTIQKAFQSEKLEVMSTSPLECTSEKSSFLQARWSNIKK